MAVVPLTVSGLYAHDKHDVFMELRGDGNGLGYWLDVGPVAAETKKEACEECGVS